MNHNKISLILTVKNEEKSIRNLLESILYQSKIPDEIIIVDGGSTDKTTKIIKKYFSILLIKLMVEEGANIPKGRNIAIANSKYPIIAVTDGGCKLDHNWVDEITKPFKKMDVDVVSGKYIATGDSLFQQLTGQLLTYDFNNINENSFSPSSRSVAFKKIAWKQVKGYPEWLDYAEDTYFNKKLKKIGKKFYLNKNAIVYWQMRKDFSKLLKQYLNYATYDAIALNNPGNYYLRIIFWLIFDYLFIFFLFFGLYLLIPLLFIVPISLISFRIIYKLKNQNLNLKKYCYGLAIFSVFELALVFGFIYGLYKKIVMRIKKVISLVNAFN